MKDWQKDWFLILVSLEARQHSYLAALVLAMRLCRNTYGSLEAGALEISMCFKK